MPGNPNNPTSVSLDVRASSSSDPGWVNVTASNGAPYSYLYTGGNAPGGGNNGNMEFSVGGGNAAATLNLVADPTRYQIDLVSFENDPAGQLSTQGNAPRTRVINDSCSAALTDGRYKVRVVDTGAGNATVQCDPVIVNK